MVFRMLSGTGVCAKQGFEADFKKEAPRFEPRATSLAT